MPMHRRTLLKSMAATFALQPLAAAPFWAKAAGLTRRVHHEAACMARWRSGTGARRD